MSYDPRLPAPLQLVIVRVRREYLDLAGYDLAARRFLEEVRAQVASLRQLSPVAFFGAAPIDVARHILAACTRTVNARGRNVVC